MSSIFTLIAVYALLVFGVIFCFFGRFPGQVLAYAGLLLAYFTIAEQAYPVWLLVVCGVLVVASIIFNKTIAPKLASKVHEYGKAGKWGTIVGSIVSLFCIMAELNDIVVIVLFFVLPYLFAFIFELIAKKNAQEGAFRALGAYTHFATTTLINLAISAFCCFVVITGWTFKAADEVVSIYDEYENFMEEYMGDSVKGMKDLSRLLSAYEADATNNMNSLIKKYQAACKNGEVVKAAQMMAVLSQYEDKIGKKQLEKIEKATLSIDDKYLEEYENILEALENVWNQDDFVDEEDDEENDEEPAQFSSEDEARYLKMVDRYEKLVERFISKQKNEGSFDYELYEEVSDLGEIINESINSCSSDLSERFNNLESVFSMAAMFGSEGEGNDDDMLINLEDDANLAADIQDYLREVAEENKEEEENEGESELLKNINAASVRILNDSDLLGLSKAELRILRNSIYARHGYIFRSDDLTNYFSQFKWYKPTSTDVTAELSDIEKKNIYFIKARE